MFVSGLRTKRMEVSVVGDRASECRRSHGWGDGDVDIELAPRVKSSEIS